MCHLSILVLFPAQHPEFSSLLKERVCALVIKLFSPNVKTQHRGVASLQQSQQSAHQQPLTADKPFFPVSVRLLRLVSVLVQKYYTLLVMIPSYLYREIFQNENSFSIKR